MSPRDFWDNDDVRGMMRKVKASPADDLARLVLADWLEDTAGGDLDARHAHFIRVSLANPSRAFTVLLEQLELRADVLARIFWPYKPKKIEGRGYMPLFMSIRGYGHAAGLIARCERGLFGCLTPVGVTTLGSVLSSLVLGTYRADFQKVAKICTPWRLLLDAPDVLEPDTISGRLKPFRVEVNYRGEMFEFPADEMELTAERLGMDREKLGSAVVASVVCRKWVDELRAVGLDIAVHMTQDTADRLAAGIYGQKTEATRSATAMFRYGSYHAPPVITLTPPLIQPPRLD